MTFIATANSIRYTGATPVFADVDLRTYNLDPDAVEAAITSRTKAILVVHQIGLPADIDRLLYYTYITGSETVIGYVISVVLAVPLGLSIAFSSILRRTLYPLCVSIEMVPKIAFAPLFVSWLGFGLLPKVIIVILVCFFPIVLNAILAFGSLNEELTRFCRMTGAGWFKTFVKVRLPAAMPQCFVGFKYAAINATVGATIAEFIGSDQGLGFYIQIVTGNMRPDLAFAGIFFLKC